jgi:hypothetical protein
MEENNKTPIGLIIALVLLNILLPILFFLGYAKVLAWILGISVVVYLFLKR